MDQIIKDNTFSVSHWIGALREAGVALLHASSSTFDVKPGHFVAEPECFITGQKNAKLALLGPYPHPREPILRAAASSAVWSTFAQSVSTAGMKKIGEMLSTGEVFHIIGSLSQYQNGNGKPQRRHGVRERATIQESGDVGNGHEHNEYYPSAYYSNEDCSSGNQFDHDRGTQVDVHEVEQSNLPHHLAGRSFKTIVAAHTVYLTEDTESYYRIMVKLATTNGSRIVILEQAPCNESLKLLNNVAQQFGIPSVYPGASLTKAVEVLTEFGFRCALGFVDDAINCPEDDILERSREIAKTLADVWFTGCPDRPAIETLLTRRLEQHFESQYEINGHPKAIGFANILLVAERESRSCFSG